MDPGVTPPSRSFVLGLADEQGNLDGAALYELAAAVGFSDTKTRLTVRRLAEAGLVETSGRGRSSTISLTPEGLATRTPDLAWTAYAYRLDAGWMPWDGHWHLASFEIPESRRVARDALREQLLALFGAPLSGGLYVSASPWEPWVHAIAGAHGVRDHVATLATTDLDLGGVTEPREIAARLWPLDEISRSATSFLARWSPVIDTIPEDLTSAARAAFAASAEFEAILRQDPILPTALLPPDWPLRTVRQTYRDLLTALSDQHHTIKQAGVFTAFMTTIDQTSAMDNDDFTSWLWAATHQPEQAAVAHKPEASTERRRSETPNGRR